MMDFALIEDFVIEAGEGLDVAVDDVLTLEQGPNQEAIDRIFRVVHTIKGTAGMLNFTAMARYVHCLEDTCSNIRCGGHEVDRSTADGLLACLDFIRAKLDHIRDHGRENEDYTCGDILLKGLCEVSDETVPSPPSRVAESYAAIRRNTRQPKALIVENDFASRKMLHSFLSRFMSCYVAKDGCEAIQAVTESYLGPNPEPFSLICIDMMLPIINGFQATRAIRAMELAKGARTNRTEAKIFITTATDRQDIRNKALAGCGADECLIKPMDLVELKQLLVRYQLIDGESGKEDGREVLCA